MWREGLDAEVAITFYLHFICVAFFGRLGFII